MKNGLAFLIPGMALGGSSMFPNSDKMGAQKQPKEINYDALIKEYKLIKQKKSGLPSANRRAIVARVELLIQNGKIII